MCWTMHILPDPWPLLIGGAQGLASDSETLCLGVRYRTHSLPSTRPRDTEYNVFYLSFASNFIILDVAPPPNIIPNRPAKKKRTHNSLNTKNSVLHGFFQLCQNLPQRVRATSKARIYQSYIFKSLKIRFSIVITIV